MTPTPSDPLPDNSVRPHVYDGIQEFNHRLPNWWLFTLYIMIVFWLGYWAYYEWFRTGLEGPQRVTQELAAIEAVKLAEMANNKLDDATLWQMSRNPAFTDAGKATFLANCVACHLPSLRGKGENPAAIGPDLTDTTWIHGGNPMDVYNTITKGVLAKGMPTWGPVLGQKKISELAAFVFSHHKEGEPVVMDPSASAAPAAAPPK